MPLEATMIVIDNSEYMRNGDYAPNRFQAQNDAVSMVFNSKTGSNPENTCGVMSMAGQSPQVLATLTQDLGKVLSALQTNHIGGSIDLPTALNVAQLALKHRENKNQRQRIVVFLGSPLVDPFGTGIGSSSDAAGKGSSEEALVKLGKKLKKNNVAVDLVLFGDEGMENEAVLSKFIEATQNSENCNLVTIPPGPHLLSDLLATSPILAGEGGAGMAQGMDQDGDFGAAAGGAGGAGGDFGIDPNMDPELAMAIRMSLQEEEERQRREAGASAPAASTETASSSTSTSAPAPIPTETPTDPLAAPEPAMPTSSEPTQAPPHPATGMPSDTSGPISVPGQLSDDDVDMDQAAAPTGAGGDGAGEEDEDEDEAMLRAIAMSMEGQEGGAKEEEKK
ncbi:hypothetical protein FFLO_03555 [Filobasidium floriforme]|uniref:VWFA domain-containing protein n=1 Tax=Filobasidium floriforme TaxID=5210 RepID=A0A8K0NQ48_9TREE|nr:uncharacterized protein HD553DRAFT_295196 [Filobasidium floriforme]KAG7535957.1 hypothetical protein FFLO_03555 [Filobasidium floriforme]KAH8086563.1 hypothetical protein HD553DRAFT_295196 [Filobasidium floriforme]